MKPNEVCAEVQLLSKHGLSRRRIAAEVGCAVNTVRRHLAMKAVTKYERKVKRPSKLTPYEAYLWDRQTAAQPNWIPASVLHSEIAARGYQGGLSQLRAFMRSLRPTLPVEPVVRFETEMGEQLQVDWVDFSKGSAPLHALCATMGYGRASHVEFVSDMKVATLIGCHERAFAAFGGVPRKVLYDSMKTGQAKDVAVELRRKLFRQCTNDEGPAQFADMEETFKKWLTLMAYNTAMMRKWIPLSGQIATFHVDRQPGAPVI